MSSSRTLAAMARVRDPGLRVTKKAVRAAVVVPGAFALGEATGRSDTAIFALFGSFALTLMVDFVAPPAGRCRAYVTLVAAGTAFIAVGTVCSQNVAAAVALMACVAFAILLGSVASPLVVQATTASLLMLVLPLCLPAPPSAVGARVLGFLIAAGLALPAVLLVWPTPYRSRLRSALASTSGALAGLAGAHAAGRRAPPAAALAAQRYEHLLRVFEETPFIPTGAARADDALCKLVSLLGRVKEELVAADRVGPGPPDLPGIREMYEDARAFLHLVEPLLEHPGGSGRRDLLLVMESMRRRRNASLARIVDEVARRGRSLAAAFSPEGGPGETGAARDGQVGPVLRADPGGSGEDGGVAPTAGVEDIVDPAFRSRALACVLDLVGQQVLAASQVPSEVPWEERVRDQWRGARERISSHLTTSSVWFRNSLRGALGISLAVLIVLTVDVQHGFWVVLGTISVLRSNASGTGSTAMRAIVGTVVGVIIGAMIVAGVGSSTTTLWALLPIVVLGAGLAPVANSFAAGQAAFTVTVLVAFDIVVPGGWRTGIVRVEDVAIGCLVALGVSLLFWPRGAGHALGGALCDALVLASAYLVAAFDRLVSPSYDLDLVPAESAAAAASRRLDDAFREYLLERGTKSVPPLSLMTLCLGADQLCVSGDLLARLPIGPLPPAPGEHPTLSEAKRSLRRAFREIERWYGQMGDVLAGRARAIPPVMDRRPEVRRSLFTALEEAVRQEDAVRLRMVLRMRWADEDLEKLDRLHQELADAAATFATRARWWGLARVPHVRASFS